MPALRSCRSRLSTMHIVIICMLVHATCTHTLHLMLLQFAALVEDYLAKSSSKLGAAHERIAGMESEFATLQRQVESLQESLRVTRCVFDHTVSMCCARLLKMSALRVRCMRPRAQVLMLVQLHQSGSSIFFTKFGFVV